MEFAEAQRPELPRTPSKDYPQITQIGLIISLICVICG